jgi:hypothetical protein
MNFTVVYDIILGFSKFRLPICHDVENATGTARLKKALEL